MIDRLVEFLLGALTVCIVLMAISPMIVDSINYIGHQIERLEFIQ